MAREINSPRLISSALLALAEIQVLGNDSQGALTNAQQAQQIFERAGEQDSEWRSWLISARANEVVGNKSAAKESATRADSLCAGLEQKWGKDAYGGYLQRPDIQNYRRDLSQLLARSK